MIEIKNLSFRYKQDRMLFNDLDLSLTDSNIYGLLGKNGAGKTTLFKILSGLLFPQTGTCNVSGFSPQKRDVSFLQNIYLIPEEFYTPSLTIEKYEKYYSPLYPHFSHTNFISYLETFSLSFKSNLRTLSYGQKKKFFLSFGLATGVKLLLLDEPTNGLDIPTKSEFRKLLASNLTDGRIVIISTHQVRDLENLLDHVIILDDGKIIFNENMFTVAQKLKVVETKEIENQQSVLFSEKMLGGYSIITENSDNQVEDRMNLELLFNAVITEREKIGKIFNKEDHHAHI